MQHRGTARTRIVPVSTTDGARPRPGPRSRAGARRSAASAPAPGGARRSPLLRLDRVADALAAGAAAARPAGIARSQIDETRPFAPFPFAGASPPRRAA